jgi:two-component system chemotaxis response regulator CheY
LNAHLKIVAAEPEDDGAPRVLVIDDATVVRLYYRQILQAEGYVVEEAMNGLEGLEKVMQSRFDLCIVDVNMPVMDGFAFLRALRAEPATSGIPALTTTTEAGVEDHRAALHAGANFFLVKPVARQLLAAYAAALLGRPAK